jgi:hypothetical protein
VELSATHHTTSSASVFWGVMRKQPCVAPSDARLSLRYGSAGSPSLMYLDDRALRLVGPKLGHTSMSEWDDREFRPPSGLHSEHRAPHHTAAPHCLPRVRQPEPPLQRNLPIQHADPPPPTAPRPLTLTDRYQPHAHLCVRGPPLTALPDVRGEGTSLVSTLDHLGPRQVYHRPCNTVLIVVPY